MHYNIPNNLEHLNGRRKLSAIPRECHRLRTDCHGGGDARDVRGAHPVRSVEQGRIAKAAIRPDMDRQV